MPVFGIQQERGELENAYSPVELRITVSRASYEELVQHYQRFCRFKEDYGVRLEDWIAAVVISTAGRELQEGRILT